MLTAYDLILYYSHYTVSYCIILYYTHFTVSYTYTLYFIHFTCCILVLIPSIYGTKARDFVEYNIFYPFTNMIIILILIVLVTIDSGMYAM